MGQLGTVCMRCVFSLFCISVIVVNSNKLRRDWLGRNRPIITRTVCRFAICSFVNLSRSVL